MYDNYLTPDDIVNTDDDLMFSKTAEPTASTAKQKLGLEEEAAQTLKEKSTENYRNTADTLKQSSFWSRLNEGIFDGLHGIFHYGAPMWQDGIIQRKADTMLKAVSITCLKFKH